MLLVRDIVVTDIVPGGVGGVRALCPGSGMGIDFDRGVVLSFVLRFCLPKIVVLSSSSFNIGFLLCCFRVLRPYFLFSFRSCLFLLHYIIQ